MNIHKDYYVILELTSQATREQIREAYRRLAKMHHPDKNPGKAEAEEKFKEVNEAHEVLSNEVTRHVYDTHRAARQQETAEEEFVYADEHDQNPLRPKKHTKERKYYVKKERRIYVYGTLLVKFQGDPDPDFNEFSPHEQQYTIYPTECEATILESDLHFSGTPKEYEKIYSATDLFKTPLPQPINCCIKTAQGNEYYYLDIHDIRIGDLKITDVTKHDNLSFGTLEGKLYGYILDSKTEEVTEQYTEFAGPTGNIETKIEGNRVYVRSQYYATDGSTYWTEWLRDPRYSAKQTYRHERRRYSEHTENAVGNWWWLIVLLLLIAFIPKLLLIIGPVIGIYLGLTLLGLFIEHFYKILPWIGGIFLLALIGAGLFSVSDSSHVSHPRYSKAKFDSAASSTTVTGRDTLIKHFIRWQDRDSSRYSIQLSISTTAVHSARQRHQQMNIAGYSGFKEVYNSLLEREDTYIQPIASSFDSIAKANNLTQLRAASMVVSCIQSLQYSLILDKACTDRYSDPFVNDYLMNCHIDCCKGFVKFGVQSPVEFMEDLKGDCDTKALFLYAVMKQMGFKVALLTSEYYKHALIAVELDLLNDASKLSFETNGKRYYLWETTNAGFGPGILPESKSDLRNWNITLI